MALTLGKSPVKPARWKVDPKLTENPEFWRYIYNSEIGPGGVWAFWENEDTTRNLARSDDPNGPGDLTLGTNWSNSVGPRGLRWEHPDNGNDEILGITSTDPGWWHDEITAHTIIFDIFISSDSQFGPYGIYDIGGPTNGLQLAWVETDNEYKLNFHSTNGDLLDFRIPTGAAPFHHVLAIKYDGPSSGSIKAFIDGELVASTAGAGSSMPAHSSGPEFGDSSVSANETLSQGLPGGFSFIAATHYAIPDSVLRDVTSDLYSVIRPGPQIIPLFLGDAAATGTTINATTATLTTSTNAASLSLDKTLSAALATLTLSEQQSTLSLDKTINAATSSLAISGNGATLSLDTAIAATLATLSASTNTATLSLDKTVSANTANLTIAANPASLSLDIDVAAQTASLSLASQSGSISLGKQISASSATLSLAEQTASILADTVIDAQSASITASGQQATTSIDLTVSASTASLLLQSFASSVESATLIDANTASVTINALTVTIDTGGPELLSGTVTVNAALDGTITLQSALDGTITLQ